MSETTDFLDWWEKNTDLHLQNNRCIGWAAWMACLKNLSEKQNKEIKRLQDEMETLVAE